MRSKSVQVALVVGLLLYQPAVAQREQAIGDLAWLSGCWLATSGSRTVEENWTAARGGTMLGVSRTVRDGELTGYEMIVLRVKDGTLVYEAHPSGQQPAAFRATTVADRTIVFENPDHDFPQRVGYRLVGSDSLQAWIEGTLDGKSRKIDFSYARVLCPGCGAK